MHADIAFVDAVSACAVFVNIHFIGCGQQHDERSEMVVELRMACRGMLTLKAWLQGVLLCGHAFVGCTCYSVRPSCCD